MGNKSRKTYFGFDREYFSVNDMKGTAPLVTSHHIVPLNSRRVAVDDPMWKSKVKRGVSATNAFKGYQYELEFQRGFVRTQVVRPGYPGHGAYGYSDSIVTPTFPGEGFPGKQLSNAKNKAAIGIRGKIDEQSKAFTGLTMLGELRETIHMIRHPAEAMRAYSNNFFKGMHSRKLKHSRQKFGHMLANSWLEFVFGLAPFMSDIGAIADAIIPRFQEKRLKRLTFTSQDSASTSAASVATAAGISAQFPTFTEVLDEVSCRYTVWYQVEERGPLTPLQAIKELGGFNLTEIIPTAWELLPWSFFIDYFSNIGDVISANLVSMENVAFSSLTTKRTAEKRYLAQCTKAWETNDSFRKVVGSGDASFVAKLTEIERANASIPFGELRFELPGKTNQFMNMAALAQNLFVPEREYNRDYIKRRKGY